MPVGGRQNREYQTVSRWGSQVIRISLAWICPRMDFGMQDGYAHLGFPIMS